ncbi:MULTISPECIES: hypothetical protein [unclassified Kitasatospora]|uniref:hypothetical protein n=1 Tax=unclassified Kitasatospora TaxID=2633591 RepID=UPI00340FE041
MDLRKQPIEDVLHQVEQRLGTSLNRATLVRKRRTIGARTDRSTWVRVERRPWARAQEQGLDGPRAAARVAWVAMPRWIRAASWQDLEGEAVWQADETSLLPGSPVGPAVAVADPELSDVWWSLLNASLAALADCRTTRIATPDTERITQELVDDTIRAAFAEVVNTRVDRWCPAHADLNWANVTGPEFCLFDWEDWGMAPRGLDSASLLAASLAVPALADRVRRERMADLESRDGMVMRLFVLAKIAGPHAHPDDPRVAPAWAEAEQLISSLQQA